MSQKQPSLKKSRKRRIRTDGSEQSSSPKISLIDELLMESEIVKELTEQLKSIRNEMKEMKEDSEKKLEELRVETRMEMLKQKEEAVTNKSAQFESTLFICETLKDVKANQEEIKAHFLEQKHLLIRQKMTKKQRPPDQIIVGVRREPSDDVVKTTLMRQTVLGEWKMVQHENFDGYLKNYRDSTFEIFSENVKFELIDGKMKQSDGAFRDLVEGASEYSGRDLYFEGDHLISKFYETNIIDRYIQDGRLHFVQHCGDEVWKRVYEKI